MQAHSSMKGKGKELSDTSEAKIEKYHVIDNNNLSETHLERNLAHYPHDNDQSALAFCRRAKYFLLENDYINALKEANESLKLDNTNPFAFIIAGNAHLCLYQVQDFKIALLQAKLLAVNFSEACSALIEEVSCSSVEDYNAAKVIKLAEMLSQIKVLEEIYIVRIILPNLQDIKAQIKNENLNGALEALFLQINELDFLHQCQLVDKCFIEIAYNFYSLKDFDKALEFIQRVKKSPEYQNMNYEFKLYANFIHAKIFFGYGKMEQSLALINHLIVLQPLKSEYHHLAAQILIAENKFMRALEKINEAITCNPDDLEYYKLRKSLYLKLNKKPLAFLDELKILCVSRATNKVLPLASLCKRFFLFDDEPGYQKNIRKCIESYLAHQEDQKKSIDERLDELIAFFERENITPSLLSVSRADRGYLDINKAVIFEEIDRIRKVNQVTNKVNLSFYS